MLEQAEVQAQARAQAQGGAQEKDAAQEPDAAQERGLGCEQEAVAWGSHDVYENSTMHACRHPSSSQDTRSCP